MWTLIWGDSYERFDSRIEVKCYIDRHIDEEERDDVLIFPPDSEMGYEDLYPEDE